jgi:hypothetical protein
MDMTGQSEKDEGLGDNYEFYISSRKRAFSIIKINLLVYSAFIPAVTIIRRIEKIKLNSIYKSELVMIGFILSFISVGSTALTLFIINIRIRNKIKRNNTKSNTKKIENKEEKGENKVKVEIIDHITITEVLTSISVPMIFVGVASAITPIDTYISIIFVIASIIGAVATKVFGRIFIDHTLNILNLLYSVLVFHKENKLFTSLIAILFSFIIYILAYCIEYSIIY